MDAPCLSHAAAAIPAVLLLALCATKPAAAAPGGGVNNCTVLLRGVGVHNGAFCTSAPQPQLTNVSLAECCMLPSS